MAIIKCPECNHEISDKAPSCPSCGAPIAGHVTTCVKCGYTYFNDKPECPHCHYRPLCGEKTGSPNVAEASASRPQPPQENSTATQKKEPSDTVSSTETAKRLMETAVEEEIEKSSSRNNKVIIGVVVALVVIVGGLFYFFYSKTQSDREEQAYEYAMSSNDPQVLQKFLDDYSNAPEEHRDSIMAHLDMLQKLDQDWTNVVVSGSRSDFQRYIDEHPDSPFKAIAVHKIDSIDWATAQSANTVEAIEQYLEQHQGGEHVEDANDLMKKLNANTVQPEDQQLVSGVMSGLLQSLSSKDEDGLTSSFNPLITKFLGKANATRVDVVTFLNKIYKSDVSSMEWQSLGDYSISKKEIGEQKYEYTVTFSALQSVTHTDNSTTNVRYRVNAKVNPDGRITEFNMTKILE